VFEDIAKLVVAIGTLLLCDILGKIKEEREWRSEICLIAHEAEWDLRRKEFYEVHEVGLFRRYPLGNPLGVPTISNLVVILHVGDETVGR